MTIKFAVNVLQLISYVERKLLYLKSRQLGGWAGSKENSNKISFKVTGHSVNKTST